MPAFLVLVAAPPRAVASQKTGASQKTSLRPGGTDGTFDFETDRIEGTIRLDGAYHGVTRLVDKRSGRQVIDPRYSALNLFKLMSVNQAMGQPRQMQRTTTVAAGWVEVFWPATDSHQAEITARYEVAAANAVDVTITVQSKGTYAAYELFLSSYFDKVLRPLVYLDPGPRKAPVQVVPMVNDVFRGTVLVFPRDAHSARHCLDGRWDRSERKTPTVQMCPVRQYLHCLAVLTDPSNQLAVVLMSHPAHCYAFSTRYFAADDADRLTNYSAFDLSLFGGDLVPGQRRTVKVRLAVTELDQKLSQLPIMYQKYIDEVNEKRSP